MEEEKTIAWQHFGNLHELFLYGHTPLERFGHSSVGVTAFEYGNKQIILTNCDIRNFDVLDF